MSILRPNRRLASIPAVSEDLANHTQVLMALKQAVEVGKRDTSDVANSFVRVQDLVDIGLIDLKGGVNASIGADFSQIAGIGDLSGAAAGDFLRFDGSEWGNQQLGLGDITQGMVTQHQAALSIDWGQLTNTPDFSGSADIQYTAQSEADKSWFDNEFVRGTNIIGVRTAGAIVRLPIDLSVEKLVYVKNETGGSVTVVPYDPTP